MDKTKRNGAAGKPANADGSAEQSAGQGPKRGTWARWTFLALSGVYAICIAIQVFLAGLSIFANPIHWSKHTNFIHFIEYLPLLMLIFSFAGRLPAAMRWQSFGLFALVMAMYATANLAALSSIVAAFHPVLALAMFWLSVIVAGRAWRLTGRREAR